MKNKVLMTIAAVCLLMAACGNSAREEFLAEHTEVTDELIRLIDTDQSLKGVDAARAYLESKKPSLRRKFEAGRSSFYSSTEESDKFLKVITANYEKLAAFEKKHGDYAAHPWKTKISVLFEDFQMFLLKAEK